MTNLPPPELFPQRPIRSDFIGERPYRMRRTVTVVVMFAVIAAGLYLKLSRPAQMPEDIPTIKAEGPLKEKPEQPGGITIPHQDVLAYQQLDNSGAGKQEIEHLLPPPETPQAPPAVQNPPPPPEPAQVTSPKIETLQPPPLPQLATTVTEPKTGAPATVVAPTPTAPAASTPPTPATSAAAPAAATAPAAVASAPLNPPAKKNKAVKEAVFSGKTGYRVQLASIADQAGAATAAKKLQAKYASQLGKAKLHLTKADLGARGVFYRVQSNPVSNSEARDICAALKSAGAGCIVVRP